MRVFVAVLAWLLLPAPSRADVITTPPPCDPGSSRHTGGIASAGMMWGHGHRPSCEPAICQDASTCGPEQQCRADRHCVQSRTQRELRPSPGHGRRFDPDDPASWHDVTRTYDGGRCAPDGQCPDGWQCLQIATCRPNGEADAAPLATAGNQGNRAERAWGVAQPLDPNAAPEEPSEAAPPEAAEPAPAPSAEPETTQEAPTEPAPAAAAPPTATPDAGGCGCRASARSGAPAWLVALAALALLRRRHAGG